MWWWGENKGKADYESTSRRWSTDVESWILHCENWWYPVTKRCKMVVGRRLGNGGGGRGSTRGKWHIGDFWLTNIPGIFGVSRSCLSACLSASVSVSVSVCQRVCQHLLPFPGSDPYRIQMSSTFIHFASQSNDNCFLGPGSKQTRLLKCVTIIKWIHHLKLNRIGLSRGIYRFNFLMWPVWRE